jgi:N-acetyl-anhydromuramyl-L-alanine amidase AmpD
MSYYLLENENPNAKLRDNGKQGNYYPTRSKDIQGIVVHTAEGGRSAVGIAKYLSTTDRTASAHVVIDDKEIVELVPDDFTAFHCRGSNSKSLGLEIAYFADKWGEDPVYEEAVIALSASWCAEKADAHNIPMERVTIDEWNAGKKGFISHAECDPSRRTDPGANFDWDKFFAYMKGMVNNVEEYDDIDTEFEEVKEKKETQVYDFSVVPKWPGRVFKRNSPLIRGVDVKQWQNAVGGLSGDGIYGGKSEQACVKFQKEHGLKVDGIVGKITWDTTFAYQK